MAEQRPGQALSDAVPSPPVVDSVEDKSDYAQVLAAQNARTPEVIAECNQFKNFGYQLFGDIYRRVLVKTKWQDSLA